MLCTQKGHKGKRVGNAPTPTPRRHIPGGGAQTGFQPTQLGSRLAASSVGSSRALLPGSPGGQAVLQGCPAQPRTFWWVTGRHGACDPLGRKDRAKGAAVLSLPRTRMGGRVSAGDLKLHMCTWSAPDAQPGLGEEPGSLPGGL